MTKKLKNVLLLAIFIGGYASLSLEIIAIRQLAGFVGTTAITTSIIIGIFLAFMSFGYYKGTSLKIKYRRPKNLFPYGFATIAGLIVIGVSYPMVEAYFRAMHAIGIISPVAQTFTYSLIFLSFGPFLFGVMTAVASRYLHKKDSNFTGKVMAVDTVGSVFGSILTTLVLMPFIGTNYTIVWVVAVTLFGAFILKRNYISLIILAFAIAMNMDATLHKRYNIVKNNAVSTTVLEKEDNGISKVLIINGGNSSKVSSDDRLLFPYIRYIQYFLIDTLPETEKKDILLLGAGGFTLGRNDTFHNYTYVDIDRDLKEIAEELFLKEKLSENKEFIVEDASQYLKRTEKKYDLIVLDTYATQGLIPEDLITLEYFSRVKARVKENGIVAMNIIADAAFENTFSKKIDNTLRTVFKDRISRQIMGPINPWEKENTRNIIYMWFNKPVEKGIYTLDKNSYFYDY